MIFTNFEEACIEIERLDNEINFLKTTIEKMKCCGNCEHILHSVHGDISCKLDSELTLPGGSCDDWKRK